MTQQGLQSNMGRKSAVMSGKEIIYFEKVRGHS
jgi:hypothetical protein